jgi:hypothetical protein
MASTKDGSNVEIFNEQGTQIADVTVEIFSEHAARIAEVDTTSPPCRE